MERLSTVIMAPPKRSTLQLRRNSSGKVNNPSAKDAQVSMAIRPLAVRSLNGNGYSKSATGVVAPTPAAATSDVDPKTASSVDVAFSPELAVATVALPSMDRSIELSTSDADIFHDDEDDETQQSVCDNLSATRQKVRPITPPPTMPSQFQPPSEVMLMPDFVPPSPMADPSFEIFHLSHRRNSESLLHDDNVDHVRLKHQLWDAQRLVRVILGRKPSEGDLENGAILQAIRSYAEMRQKLLQLQQQVRLQEEKVDESSSDPQPTTFLQSLESPASTAGERRSVRSFSSDAAAASTSESPSRSSTGLRSVPTGHPRPFDRSRIIEAAKKIQSLENQLKEANVKLKTLEKQSDESSPPSREGSSVAADDLKLELLAYQRRIGQMKLDNEHLQCQLDESQTKLTQSELKVEQLNEKYNQSIADCKTQVEEVSVHLHSIPKSQVEPKRAQEIRTKLQMLIRTLAKHSAQADIEKLQSQLVEQEKNAQREIEQVRRQLVEQQRLSAKYELQLQGSSSVVGQDACPDSTTKEADQAELAKKSVVGGIPTDRDVEEILLQLSHVPAESLSSEERNKIRDHIRSMVQSLANPPQSNTHQGEEKTEEFEHFCSELEALKSTSEVRVQELKTELQASRQSFEADLCASKAREQHSVKEVQQLTRQLQELEDSREREAEMAQKVRDLEAQLQSHRENTRLEEDASNPSNDASDFFKSHVAELEGCVTESQKGDYDVHSLEANMQTESLLIGSALEITNTYLSHDSIKAKFDGREIQEQVEDSKVELQCGVMQATELFRASQARADRLQAERDLVVGKMSNLSLQLVESRLRIDELVERLAQGGLDCGSHSLGLESPKLKYDDEGVGESKEKDTHDSPCTSRRLQMLHEEHDAVLSTIRVLEEEKRMAEF